MDPKTRADLLDIVAGLESRLADDTYPRQAAAEYALYSLQHLTGTYEYGTTEPAH